jgi:hypothetical protein
MLPKPREKKRALMLRREGLSYSEILKTVPVAQATLSLWLRHIRLTDKQKKRLKDISQGAGVRARREQRIQGQNMLFEDATKEMKQLIKDPFFMLGLAFYWAEGAKQKPWNVSACMRFANSDERTILIMKLWFSKFFKLSEKDFTYTLHIHTSADIQQAKKRGQKSSTSRLKN